MIYSRYSLALAAVAQAATRFDIARHLRIEGACGQPDEIVL